MQIGDVVRLKSGGPEMTINSIRDGEFAIAFCKWFDEIGQLHNEKFALTSLVLSSSDDCKNAL